MDQQDIALARIARDLVMFGIQAATAFDHAQSSLGLERILDPDRLTTEKGLAESRDALRRLTELVYKHKEMFSTFTTGAASQLLAAVGQLPDDQRERFQDAYIHSINWNMQCQAKFYEGRERWISAASRALKLAEENFGDIRLDGDRLVFASDWLLDEVCALIDVMDRVRESEMALLQERQAHIAAAVARIHA